MTPYEERTYPQRKCCDSRVEQYHRTGCMTGPTFTPVDADTGMLLDLIASQKTPLGKLRVTRFLEACQSDAQAHGGIVDVNRVRAALTVDGELQIESRAFSALWSVTTGPGKPMVKTGNWITCAGSSSRNDGRPYPERRWVA